MKRKKIMPRFYGKNIVRNAQKKFFRRKALDADKEKRLNAGTDRPVKELENPLGKGVVGNAAEAG